MGYYLNKIEDLQDRLIDGKVYVDRFPPLIGVHPDLLVRGDLRWIGVTITFTLTNGSATYRVIAQENGVLIATCDASDLTEVPHGPD